MAPASSLAIGRALALAPRPRGARTDRRARGALPRGASRRRPPLGAQPHSRAAGHAPPGAAASRVALTAEDLTPETFAPFGQAAFGGLILTLIFTLIFTLLPGYKVRMAIRKRDGIPGSNCEECCYAWCCNPCTQCLIFRHEGRLVAGKYSLCSPIGTPLNV